MITKFMNLILNLRQPFILLLMFVTFLSFSFPKTAQASSDLQEFLKNCAYGTLGGAVLGVVSLALADKPSEHSNNITRGASLGLYIGIGYGLVKLNEVPAPTVQIDPYAAIVPLLNKNKIDGAKLVFNVARF